MNTDRIQPEMNDREHLAELMPKPVERDLSSGRRQQIEELVMSQVHMDTDGAPEPRRMSGRRRMAFATTGLAAVAAVAVAATVIGTGSGGVTDPDQTTADGNGSVATELSATETFELAASHAATEPFTPPQPDQWIYLETQSHYVGAVEQDKGMEWEQTTQFWRKADGSQEAVLDGGELHVWDVTAETIPPTDYPTLSTLPTDPQELLDWVYELVESSFDGDGTAGGDVPEGEEPAVDGLPETPPVDDQGIDVDAYAFSILTSIMWEGVLPPEVTASLMRAAGLIPDVIVSPEPVEIDGHEVIAVGRIQDGWLFEQVLLDPETYAYVGYRSEAAKDHTIEGGPNGPIEVKKGEVQSTATRLASAIVDEAGDTA
ncbi:hypothetical protein FB566_2428 [Stackebrandtia endophytica]|uniref:CU044_5270 family protein n=1 Tax=Stackebrandtia endophytica TaxID=1496996 RepID=A0A543AWC1_9ACTN|nr:CU044_5270 family protein [Stackebrandtia endophytica]TQL76886.1 hypothetical protein FB566_2428 [Stackebrandtia endophytica]